MAPNTVLAQRNLDDDDADDDDNLTKVLGGRCWNEELFWLCCGLLHNHVQTSTSRRALSGRNKESAKDQFLGDNTSIGLLEPEGYGVLR